MRWHEPDDARVSRPDVCAGRASVTGLGLSTLLSIWRGTFPFGEGPFAEVVLLSRRREAARWDLKRTGQTSRAGKDPVRLGGAASLAQPGENATGINVLPQEVVAKRLAPFHRAGKPARDRSTAVV